MAGGPIGSGAREGIPTCPRHSRSHVVRGGTYGRAGARRQLFYCYPPESNAPTSRQFSHRVVTNAEYRAYAAACCAASDQEDCLSGEFLKTGSSPVGGALCN